MVALAGVGIYPLLMFIGVFDEYEEGINIPSCVRFFELLKLLKLFGVFCNVRALNNGVFLLVRGVMETPNNFKNSNNFNN